MKHSSYVLLLLLCTLLSGCEDDDPLKKLKFRGIWTIEQTLANDFWGGPFYWRTVDWKKQIKFTSNHYYEKTSGDFELIGTYRVISDNTIEITWDSPILPQYPTFQLTYEFDNTGRLTLHKNQTEGIVAEKYKWTGKSN